jgi:hypothetical protein
VRRPTRPTRRLRARQQALLLSLEFDAHESLFKLAADHKLHEPAVLRPTKSTPGQHEAKPSTRTSPDNGSVFAPHRRYHPRPHALPRSTTTTLRPRCSRRHRSFSMRSSARPADHELRGLGFRLPSTLVSPGVRHRRRRGDGNAQVALPPDSHRGECSPWAALSGFLAGSARCLGAGAHPGNTTTETAGGHCSNRA